MTNQCINLVKFGLTALSFTIAMSLAAQDKEPQGMNRMWGKQKIISRSDIGDKAAKLADFRSPSHDFFWACGGKFRPRKSQRANLEKLKKSIEK